MEWGLSENCSKLDLVEIILNIQIKFHYQNFDYADEQKDMDISIQLLILIKNIIGSSTPPTVFYII